MNDVRQRDADEDDIEIINCKLEHLMREALDVLGYQILLWDNLANELDEDVGSIEK